MLQRRASAAALLLALAACTGSPSAGAPTSPLTSDPSPSPSPTRSLEPTPSPTPTIGPPVHDIRGPLHVVGTSLVDEQGHPVRLISMHVPGMNRGDGTKGAYGKCPGWRPPDSAAYRDIPAWGFNSVRLSIAWANLESTPPTKDAAGDLVHHYNAAYIRALDGVVRSFTSNGVAVVLDMAQVRWSPAFLNIELGRGNTYKCGAGLPKWLYPGGGGATAMAVAERRFFATPSQWNGLIDAWTFLAHHYARRPLVIGADILNESYDLAATPYPGVELLTPQQLNLKRFYETVGRAINAVQPSWLLVYEDNMSKSTGKMALSERPDLPNGVYSVHVYGSGWSDARGGALVRLYSSRAADWGVPMWIGEFTAFGYTDRSIHNPRWEVDLRTFLRYCRSRDIGWTIVSYAGGRFLIKGTTRPKPGIVDVLRTGF